MAAVPLAEVVSYIDDLLSVSTYTEEASNQLMVDGGRPIERIAAAVNTSFASIRGAEQAVQFRIACQDALGQVYFGEFAAFIPNAGAEFPLLVPPTLPGERRVPLTRERDLEGLDTAQSRRQ